MTTITIPEKINKNEEWVAIPRQEYQKLLELKKIREYTPTPADKKALARAEKNLREGKTLSYNELVKKLGFTS